MKIYTDIDGKTYFYNVVKLINSYEIYSKKNEKSLTAIDFDISDILGVSEDTVKSYRLINSQKFIKPSSIEYVKSMGKYFWNDEFAFLVLNNGHDTSINYDDIQKYRIDNLRYVYYSIYKILSVLDMTGFYNPIKIKGKEIFVDSDIDKMFKESEKLINVLLFDRKKDHDFYLEILNDIKFIVKPHSIPFPVCFKKWAAANPNLYWYHPAFELLQDEKSYVLACEKKLIDYFPSKNEIKKQKEYFKKIDEEKKLGNFDYSLDYYFQQELILALNNMINKYLNESNDK